MQYLNKNSKRPISPHLGIYKPQMSSVLSILHRMTGVVSYLGLVVLIWWITSVAFSPNNPTDTWFWHFFSSTIGLIIAIGWSYAMFFHFCTGIRHLMFDAHIGLSIRGLHISGWVALVSSVLLTALTWIIILSLVG